MKYIICSFILFLTFSLIAEGRGVGTSASSSLKIGVGGRSVGMGETAIAAVNDVSSIFWNPAGLVLVDNSQFSAMHIEWFSDIRYEWIGFAQPITDKATIAVDISYLHTGTIPRTIESLSEGYEQNGTFSPADIAGRIAFASKIIKNLLIGGSIQRLQSRVEFNEVTNERINDKIAQSIAVDLGCIYDIPIVKGLSIAGCLQNFGNQTHAFFEEKEPMPSSINFGTAYKKIIHRKETKESNSQESNSQLVNANIITIAMDICFPSDNSPNIRVGGEYTFANGISIRSGYRTGTGFDFPSGICGGLGYDSDEYCIDYAFVPYGSLGSTHRVSLTIRF